MPAEVQNWTSEASSKDWRGLSTIQGSFCRDRHGRHTILPLFSASPCDYSGRERSATGSWCVAAIRSRQITKSTWKKKASKLAVIVSLEFLLMVNKHVSNASQSSVVWSFKFLTLFCGFGDTICGFCYFIFILKN